MILHRPARNEIVREARRLFDAADFAREDGSSHAHCLYWTGCALHAASTHGLRLIVQAGSAHFLRLPRDLDDGRPTTLTHFSYVWCDPKPGETLAHLEAGRLPECHVWAADPARMEVVDLTTGKLPEQCEETSGMKWLSPRPADFLWASAKEIPDGWGFEPSRDATLMAMMLIRDTVMPRVRDAAGR